MPTPSSTGPQPPYNVTATCPDPEEQQQTPRSPLEDWHQYHVNMDLEGDSPEDRGLAPDDNSSRSTTTSPGPHFASSDGPLPDLGDTSPSTTHSQESVDSQKMTETDDEPTDSPCDSIPADSIETSRPRHGVGTDVLSNYSNIHTDTHSEIEHGMEEEYDLPSMGYVFPSQRVCTLSPAISGWAHVESGAVEDYETKLPCPDHPYLAIIILASREPIYRNTAIRETGLRCPGRDQIC